MRPEIIHNRPTSNQRHLDSLPLGTFFALSSGGLLSKAGEGLAFVWEAPPLNPNLEGCVNLPQGEIVFIVKAKIEVTP